MATMGQKKIVGKTESTFGKKIKIRQLETGVIKSE